MSKRISQKVITQKVTKKILGPYLVTRCKHFMSRMTSHISLLNCCAPKRSSHLSAACTMFVNKTPRLIKPFNDFGHTSFQSPRKPLASWYVRESANLKNSSPTSSHVLLPREYMGLHIY